MLKCCFESKQITYNDIKHKQLNYNDIKHKQLNYDNTKPNLQELVSAFEAAVDSDRSVTEDEADVMVGTNLHSLLHINSPLQADSQAPTLTKLWQLGHLLSKRWQSKVIEIQNIVCQWKYFSLQNFLQTLAPPQLSLWKSDY